jgi:thioredoxin-related protein
MRFIRLAGFASLALAVLALAAPGAARACDIKIHDAALNQWPRNCYLLYLVHSNAANLTPAQEAMIKSVREKTFADANADVVKLNLDGSMLREDREFLSAQGCNGWPQLVILDKEGQQLARVSGAMDKKGLERLAERLGMLSPGARAVVLAPKSDEKTWKAAGEITAESLAAAGLKDLKVETLDTEAAANKELAAKYAPPKLPAMFLVTPRGETLASFPGDVTERQLGKSLDSSGRRDLTKTLDKGQVAMAFVYVSGKDKKANAAAEKIVKSAIKQADKLLKVKVGRVDVEADDASEALFIKNLGVKEGPAVVPVFGKGKHLEPLVGQELTEDNLMDRAGFMLQNCTCVLNPDALGEDLLLKWQGIDKRVKMER